MPRARCQAELVTLIILVVVAVSALAIVSNIVISNVVRSQQIRGEIVDYNIVVEDTPSTPIGTMKVSILVSCTGPNCDKCYIDNITVSGYDRATGNRVVLVTDSTRKYLRSGVTKVDVVAYYNSPPQFNELVVTFNLMRPTGGEVVFKSITLR
ncbi:MAG: hypothetical protein QW067_08225 [Thermofilaceae archaeon]